MTDVDRRPDDEAEYRDHLRRSASVWDRWSDWYTLSEEDFAPIRASLVDDLDLQPGDRVLDVGCGPGVNFELLREAVGEAGHVVAVDYSPEMVRAARLRIEDRGWENVTVERADATTAGLGSDYDGAVATLSMSVMPDIDRAVRNVHASLAPGAPFGVLDLGPVESGPLRAANPLLRRFLRWYANWNPDGDVRAAIDTAFGGYDLLGEHMLGTVYTLRARKPIDDPRRGHSGGAVTPE